MASQLTADQEKANQVYRTAVTGFFIHHEEYKTAEITAKDGSKAVDYKQDADGLFSITMKMPYGPPEHWKQTDLMLDGPTGVKVMGWERRNADGSTYTDPKSGKPQAILNGVGNMFTNEDIATFSNIVEGKPVDYEFSVTDKMVDRWAQNMQERRRESAAAGAPMLPPPEVTVGTHSMGAFSVGIGLHLRELGLDPPKLTVEVEPVGAGAALYGLARDKAKDYFHTQRPTADEIKLVMDIASENVVSLRAPNTIFQAPGGWWTHSNSMIGETYIYDSRNPGSAGLMADHKLSVVATDLLQNGTGSIHRTPLNDTSTQSIVHDTLLNPLAQTKTEASLLAFKAMAIGVQHYSHAPGRQTEYNGDIHIAQTDLHESAQGRATRSYASLKAGSQAQPATALDHQPRNAPHHEMKLAAARHAATPDPAKGPAAAPQLVADTGNKNKPPKSTFGISNPLI